MKQDIEQLIVLNIYNQRVMELKQDQQADFKNHAKIFNLFAVSELPIETQITQIFEQNFNGNHTVLSQLNELTLMLHKCMTEDSKLLLQIEENIKNHVSNPGQNPNNKVFLIFTAVFAGFSHQKFGDATDLSIQQLAGLVLKNSIKSHYSLIQDQFEGELSEIEKVLYLMLQRPNHVKKVYTELTLIISEIIKKKFNAKGDDFESNDLFLSMIAAYNTSFNLVTLDCLIQIFEQVYDDRLAKFVPFVLSKSITYLEQVNQSQQAPQIAKSKLLYFIQILYKNIEWAINVDPNILDACVKDPETLQLLATLLNANFVNLPAPSQLPENILTKFNFMMIEEKRLTSKILTILVRDHSILKKMYQQGQTEAFNQVFKIAIQNLVFFYPVFLFFINEMTKEAFDSIDEKTLLSSEQQDPIFMDADFDYEVFEQEVKAYVAQLIELVNTLMNLCPKKASQNLFLQFISSDPSMINSTGAEDQIYEVISQILQLMLGYCSMSKQDYQILADGSDMDAQNAFLITFLETEEDQFNQVSIRLSVTEFIEEIGIADDSYFDKLGINQMGMAQADQPDRKVLMKCITNLYQGGQGIVVNDPKRIQVMLQNYQSVNQVNIMTDLFLLVAQNQIQVIQLREIALFAMGIFRENILVQTPENTAFIQNLLLVDLVDKDSNALIVMRILWLFEKLAYHESFFRGEDKDEKLTAIFEKLVDLFICSNETAPSVAWSYFPIKYQCLRTLYKYTKKVNLKNKYADNMYAEILCQIFTQINGNLLKSCNEETIDIPIQALTYYSKIDFPSTRAFVNSPGCTFMQNLEALYQKYHQEGLLGDDIVDLIKIQSCIPENTRFKQCFLPMVKKTLEIFYNCVIGINSGQQNSSYQEQAQMIIDSNQLKSMMAILNTYLLNNNDASNLSQALDEEKVFYIEMFKMISEILNSYKDTYVSLHCVLSLASFFKKTSKDNNIFQQFMPDVKSLLSKLANSNVGLDESSSLYMGHLILNFLKLEMDDMLLYNCMLRVMKSSLPSCQKSYALPIQFIFYSSQRDMLPQLIVLLSQKEGKPALIKFLECLIKAFRSQMETVLQSPIHQDMALRIQALGLCGLLKYTTQDLEIACLQVDGMQLQNVLVGDISQYLVKVKAAIDREQNGPVQNEEAKGFDDRIDMYGDEYGGGDYGLEDNDLGYGDYGNEGDFGHMEMYGVDLENENFGAEMAALGSAKNEESSLLDHIFEGTTSEDIMSQIKSSISQVGQQSIQKIVLASEDKQIPASKKYTDKQKDLLNQIFA